MDKPLPLSTKKRPRQSRSQETFELIVETAGRLLDEVGFEQLTTNLVCERAGLTPPALYRYFPNKYALLRELGDRIMQLQDEAVFRWIDAGGPAGDTTAEQIRRLLTLQTEIIELTRNFPGNIAIMRALRAAPPLHDLRIASRDAVAQRLSIVLARTFPSIPAETLRVHTKLSTELMYAATEMVLEEGGPDAALLTEEACRVFVVALETLEAAHGGQGERPGRSRARG
ncbi:TetR/AcrR family transcriptional regulator [Phenylobacterium sp.]|uniref:TetR/AcrR family transcriptional regulator n=1 Tax=Phenylobacterium sp. TaxID=1871053 RepID=UPI0035AFDB0D